MLDMCKYNMASQQNSMTQSIYSLGFEELDITNMGLMTQHSSHTNIQAISGSSMSGYRHMESKKALGSLTIYQILPRAQDRS